MLIRLLLFLTVVPALNATEKHSSAVVRTTPEAGVRFMSGLTVCDEVLRNGRWLNRYWLSTGMVKPDFHLSREVRSFDGAPQDAFELFMEGQDLAGSWRWVGSSESRVQNPEGLLRVVELESQSRPVRVKVNTLLHGGPVMIRWLEITNTGKKATAITKVSPWSGMLWDTATSTERVKGGSDAVFETAFTQYQDWGHEGAWQFHSVGNSTKSVSGTRGKSGWGHPTFFARNNATGEWFVGSLGWSGNWTITLTGKHDPADNRSRLFMSMGPSAADPALRVVGAGETVRSPEAHMLVMRAGLDQVIQALHAHVRQNVLPPMVSGREYQVEANHRGYIVDHEDEAGLKREVDLGADAGAEMFVIDAGWYGPEPNRGGRTSATGIPEHGSPTTSPRCASTPGRKACCSACGWRSRASVPPPSCARNTLTGS